MKRLATILILMTLTGLFYVYEEVEAVKVGYEIRKLDQEKALQLDRMRALKYNIARLKAPEVLEKRLLLQKIKLESPRSWQTMTVPADAGVSRRNPWLAKAWFVSPGTFSKFFLGTAQAEAKETSR